MVYYPFASFLFGCFDIFFFICQFGLNVLILQYGKPQETNGNRQSLLG